MIIVLVIIIVIIIVMNSGALLLGLAKSVHYVILKISLIIGSWKNHCSNHCQHHCIWACRLSLIDVEDDNMKL